MATKLTARLLFEGIDTAKKQLLELGKVGERAFKDISEAAKSTSSAFAKFGADVDRVKRQVQAMGAAAATVGRGVSQVGAGLGTATRRIGLATAAAAGFAAAAFNIAKSGAEAADQAGKLATRAGLSVKTFSRLAFAFEQDDVAAEDFAQSMNRLNKTVGAALKGGKAEIDLFKSMGIALRDNKGKFVGTEVVLGQIAEAFRRAPDGIGKSNAAIAIFGKSGAALIPTLNQGVLGLRELTGEADLLGRTIDKEQSALGDDFGDAIGRTSAALKGLKIQLGLALAPGVIDIANRLTDAIVRNRDVVISAVTQGWRVFYQVVRDVFNAFRGNDGEVANKWIITARDNIIAFADTVSGAFNGIILPLLARVREVFQILAVEINKLFGTNLTGDQLALAVILLKVTGLFQSLAGVITIVTGGVNLLVASVQAFIALFPLMVSGATLAGTALRTLFVFLLAPLQAAAVALAALVGWPALIVAGITIAAVAIVGFWDEIKAGLQGVWDFAKTVAAGIAAAFNSVAGFVGNVVDAATGKRETGSAVVRRAGGGMVRGPGTGTSDSIMAMLSNGEYVLRAAAVRALGTNFLDGLNMGRLPAFAEGGPVTGRPVNISLDGQSFALNGGNDVVESLTKHARQASLRQFVKKPGWSTKR